MATLDGWRGLAILGVLISHFTPITGVFLGRFGVDLFFVLSGTLMSRILFEQRVPLAKFYQRRVSRILPVFFIFVASMYVLAAFARIRFTVPELLATLTFTRTYLPADLPIWPALAPVGHLWSLNVEEHSYLLLSAFTLLPFLRGREGYALIAAGLGCVACIGWYWTHPATRVTDDYMLRTECAAIGLMLSAGYRQFASRVRVHALLPIAAVLAAAALYVESVPRWGMMVVAPFLLAFAVNHLHASKALVAMLELRPLRRLGVLSFSIYLWQQPLYQLYHEGQMSVVAAVTLAVSMGAVSFYGIEQPAREWLNSFRAHQHHKHWVRFVRCVS